MKTRTVIITIEAQTDRPAAEIKAAITQDLVFTLLNSGDVEAKFDIQELKVQVAQAPKDQ